MKNCISRFCLLALLLLMTIAPVRAEIIGQTTENEYIHRLIADNGQELCFVSGEKDPCLSYADVNFDGINDVVILTQRGASNFVYQFFIFDGEQYVLCPLTFTNYDLDAERKIVRSSVNGGYGTFTSYSYDCLFHDIRPVAFDVCDGCRCQRKQFFGFWSCGRYDYRNTGVTICCSGILHRLPMDRGKGYGQKA